MNETEGLLNSGWRRVAGNKRYIIWFYVLNVTMAWFGAGAFNNQVHLTLDHSLHANGLVHGFDLGVLMEMLTRPDFRPRASWAAPATHFAVTFLIAAALFMPGVLQGYASTYRLPREDFFRACGRNLWRFIRLMIVAGIVMGAVAAALFGLHGMLERKAAESANELLLPEVQFAGLLVIFLVMTALRICFDVAQADVVLSDQRAVRKSIASGFRHVWQNLGRLLAGYVVIAMVAAFILLAGLWAWRMFVPAASVGGAVFIGQLTLLLLLIPRFWQRGVAVSYYLQNMVEPIAVQPFTPTPAVPPVAAGSTPAPVIPGTPPETQGA